MRSFIASPQASPSGRLARRLGHDERGSVAILFAFMLVALCLFIGAAVDFSRWLQARHQTIAAMDAAVLAGGRVLQLDDKNIEGARAAAALYYTENVKGRTPVIKDTIAFNPIENNTAFVASGNAYIKTAFLGLANIKELPLLNTAEANFSKAVLAAGGSSNSAVEISLMLDVTGSMAGTKITDLKKAASDLVNIVISSSPMQNPVRMAIVPFAEGVRLPTSANTAARGSPASSVSVTYTSGRKTKTATYKRTECVVERAGTNKYTDVAPGSNNYVMTLFNASGSCGLSADDEMMPLSADKTALKNKIDSLDIAGSTAGQVGTAWAWYTLSPNWNSLWPAAAKATAYDAGTRKFAILMTDGEYNLQYDAKGITTGENGAGAAANGDSTTQARSICTAMKATGITVYTVGFALGGNQTAIQTLSQCATNAGTAYTADNGSQLQQAFRDIALKITQLYLTH
jgi:Flp pilus assembly protein TadG